MSNNLADVNAFPRFSVDRPTPFAALSRREISCLLFRYERWRGELVASIGQQVAAEPTTPVGSNQRLVAYRDDRIEELHRELGRRGAVAR